MTTNLSKYALTKTQMNRIAGGKKFNCQYSDIGYIEGGECSGDIVFNNVPENYDSSNMEAYLQQQLGDEFGITCWEISQ